MDWGVGLFVTLIASANAYSSGAPKDACGTLIPGHGGSPQDNSDSPYIVKLATTTMNSDSTLEVTLEGSESFKGFMMQVITLSYRIFPLTFPLTYPSRKLIKFIGPGHRLFRRSCRNF